MKSIIKNLQIYPRKESTKITWTYDNMDCHFIYNQKLSYGEACRLIESMSDDREFMDECIVQELPLRSVGDCYPNLMFPEPY